VTVTKGHWGKVGKGRQTYGASIVLGFMRDILEKT
jgi:hypothetical protein